MFLAKDKRLLESFKRGDKEAMDVVYRHYQRGVTSFLRKGFTFRSGTGHFFFKGIAENQDLENAVQEVFRRAFEERARLSYNGVNSFTNWVLAIGRNMVINQFRNREIAFSDYISPSDERGHLTILDDEVTEEYSGVLYGRPSRPQDSVFEHGELKGLIDSFTKELTEHDRKLLIYRFADGLGQEETARVLGSTRMRVRTAEARLRHRLRAYLRHSGYLDNLPSAHKTGEGREVSGARPSPAAAAAAKASPAGGLRTARSSLPRSGSSTETPVDPPAPRDVLAAAGPGPAAPRDTLDTDAPARPPARPHTVDAAAPSVRPMLRDTPDADAPAKASASPHTVDAPAPSGTLTPRDTLDADAPPDSLPPRGTITAVTRPPGVDTTS